MTNYYFPIIYIVPLISVDGQAFPRLFITPEIRHEKISYIQPQLEYQNVILNSVCRDVLHFKRRLSIFGSIWNVKTAFWVSGIFLIFGPSLNVKKAFWPLFFRYSALDRALECLNIKIAISHLFFDIQRQLNWMSKFAILFYFFRY